jgi:hypothetical protein
MSSVEIAVIVPLEDPRGDVVEHLRGWTDRQTLDRERYQLVAGADGRHPDFERAVSEILQPQDEIVGVSGSTSSGRRSESDGYISLMELYDAAARAARAEVLVFTEAHVHADPGCLEAVAERFGAEPELAAAMFNHSEVAYSEFAKLSARWFDRCHAMWDSDDWIRLKIGGAAIRPDAYARAGGLDPKMELFAPFFLSARIDEQGGRVEQLEEARIAHVQDDEMAQDLQHTRSHARGECLARAKHDPEFIRRYFGPAGLWERRLAYRPEVSRALVAALVAAAKRNPGDAGWLGRELAAHLPASLAGGRIRGTWEKAVAAGQGKVANSELFPFETRWRGYIASTEHAVNAVEVEEGTRMNGGPGPGAAVGTLHAAVLGSVIAGVYGLERAGQQLFRWTEPAALLRLSANVGSATLRLETGGLRGAPLDYLRGIYISGRPLPAELISARGTGLEVRLPDLYSEAAADSGLVLISRPLVPARDGSSDRRRLGMPLVTMELSPA